MFSGLGGFFKRVTWKYLVDGLFSCPTWCSFPANIALCLLLCQYLLGMGFSLNILGRISADLSEPFCYPYEEKWDPKWESIKKDLLKVRKPCPIYGSPKSAISRSEESEEEELFSNFSSISPPWRTVGHNENLLTLYFFVSQLLA